MTLDIITTESAFAALEPVWDSLLDRSTTHSPFLAWDYVRLWWEQFRDEYQLRIGVVRDASSQVMAIAPFVIGADRGESRQHLRHLGFMNGLGSVQGERMDLMVPAGREVELSPLLASVISQTSGSWDVVRLNKVPEDSPNFPLLQAELKKAGTAAGVLNQSPCRCFDMPATWEEFEKTKSGNFRRNIRRHWGHLQERYTVVIKGELETPEAAAEHFFRLHAMHWPDGVSSFLAAPSRRVHEALIRKWLPTGQVLMPYVVVNDQPVGAVYALCRRGELYIYQLGWDKEYATYSMGNMSVRVCVQEAIHRGLQVADFLPGEYRYKREWSSRIRTVSDLECFHRWHPRSLAFRVLRTLKRRLDKNKAEAAQPATTSPEPEAESA